MVEEASELHLLLIEDNEGDAELFREYLDDLRGRRFRISHALDLTHGLEHLARERVELIVLDLMLPDSAGIETILRIHQAAPRTPVVVLSGLADEELGQRAIQAGAQDFLHKNALDAGSLARSLRYATERGRLQSQFRSLVENNADAIVLVNQEGMVMFINRAVEDLFGRPRAELVGRLFGFAIKGEGISEIELVRPSGDRRAAEMRVALIDWEGHSAWLASIRDVTDRKQAEELERRLHHAERLASIGQLASGVAHEVNNPAGFIHGNLGTMQEHLTVIQAAFDELQDKHVYHPGAAEPVPVSIQLGVLGIADILAEMSKMIADNQHGVERIARIVKSLSTFSRIERDEIELVDINEVIEVACTMTHNEIRHRAILHKDLESVPLIAADRGKLAQVFTNLLINAAQAIDAGAAEQNRIRVSSCRRLGEIIVCVEDTGSGIAPEHLERIFTPFFTTKPRGQGTGLGLPLSAEIIRKHGGHLRATSKLGQGTCFELTLPVETGMTVPKPAPAPVAAPVKRARARVLVVDDEVMLLEALNRMLRRTHEVVLATGGVDGVAKLEQDASFDVVICDLMMPEIDGIRFYEAVGARWPELLERIVFASGGAFTPEAKDFVAWVSKQNLVIEKPIKQQTLLHAVDSVIDRHGRL